MDARERRAGSVEVRYGIGCRGRMHASRSGARCASRCRTAAKSTDYNLVRRVGSALWKARCCSLNVALMGVGCFQHVPYWAEPVFGQLHRAPATAAGVDAIALNDEVKGSVSAARWDGSRRWAIAVRFDCELRYGLLHFLENSHHGICTLHAARLASSMVSGVGPAAGWPCVMG